MIFLDYLNPSVYDSLKFFTWLSLYGSKIVIRQVSLDRMTQSLGKYILWAALFVVVFPQSHCYCGSIPGKNSIIHLRTCTLVIYHCDFIPWWLWSWVGLNILFTVELAGSFFGHAPTSSGKFVYNLVSFTDQLWGKLTCLDVVHASTLDLKLWFLSNYNTHSLYHNSAIAAIKRDIVTFIHVK